MMQIRSKKDYLVWRHLSPIEQYDHVLKWDEESYRIYCNINYTALQLWPTLKDWQEAWETWIKKKISDRI